MLVYTDKILAIGMELGRQNGHQCPGKDLQRLQPAPLYSVFYFTA